MLADLERYSKRGGAASSSGRGAKFDADVVVVVTKAARLFLDPPFLFLFLFSPPSASAADREQPASRPGGFKAALDKLLIVDFFFVLFALAWLVAAWRPTEEEEEGKVQDGGGQNQRPFARLLVCSLADGLPACYRDPDGGGLVLGGVGWFSRRSRENEEVKEFFFLVWFFFFVCKFFSLY